MNYTLVWSRTAEDQLATAWMAAADPRAVNDAVEFIERVLGYAPNDYGESRGGSDASSSPGR